jgi:hypothetical protein
MVTSFTARSYRFLFVEDVDIDGHYPHVYEFIVGESGRFIRSNNCSPRRDESLRSVLQRTAELAEKVEEWLRRGAWAVVLTSESHLKPRDWAERAWSLHVLNDEEYQTELERFDDEGYVKLVSNDEGTEPEESPLLQSLDEYLAYLEEREWDDPDDSGHSLDGDEFASPYDEITSGIETAEETFLDDLDSLHDSFFGARPRNGLW